MYQAKQLGKGRVATFDDAVRQRLKADSELEQALANAIGRKAIELHYQPIVDFAGNLAGMRRSLSPSTSRVATSPPAAW